MAKIMISRPFFVFVLSMLTLLLLWQDVNARGHEEAAPQAAKPAEVPTEAVPDADKLKQLADSAGRYAAWRDICGDPDGADIRSDFLARAELLAPDEQADVIQHFEKRYTRKKKNAEKAVESCIRQGNTDCCTVGPSRQILGAKNRYDSHIAGLAVAAAPAETGGPAAESVAAVPAPTVSSVPNKESVVAAPKSPTPSAPPPVSSHIPATPQALDILSSYGALYAAWADACDEPVTVRQDYMAAANLLAPEYRNNRIKKFDSNYGGTYDRVKKSQAAMLLEPGTFGAGGTDPCTRETINKYKEDYENALQVVQKSDAAAKSQAAAPTSPALTGTGAASPVTAHDPGTGTLTVDGDTRSFVFESCQAYVFSGERYRVDGRAKGDAGSTLMVTFIPGHMSISVTRIAPELIQIHYMNREQNAEVFRVDGSTVTVDGAFQTTSFPATGHSIQMSFDCSG